VVTLAVGLATSLLAAIAALLIAAALARPRGLSPGDLLRVYPDLVRLLASLSRDRRVGRGSAGACWQRWSITPSRSTSSRISSQ
jgi:hypothetical protein